jgi:hypothetical protein
MVAFCFASLPLFESARILVRLDLCCLIHRKRESPHNVIGCSVSRSRLRCSPRPARCTINDRISANRLGYGYVRLFASAAAIQPSAAALEAGLME